MPTPTLFFFFFGGEGGVHRSFSGLNYYQKKKKKNAESTAETKKKVFPPFISPVQAVCNFFTTSSSPRQNHALFSHDRMALTCAISVTSSSLMPSDPPHTHPKKKLLSIAMCLGMNKWLTFSPASTLCGTSHCSFYLSQETSCSFSLTVWWWFFFLTSLCGLFLHQLAFAQHPPIAKQQEMVGEKWHDYSRLFSCAHLTDTSTHFPWWKLSITDHVNFILKKKLGFFFFFGLHLNNSIPTARHSKQAQSSNTQFTVITLQILHYFVCALGTLGAATGRGPILSFLGISLYHWHMYYTVSLFHSHHATHPKFNV